MSHIIRLFMLVLCVLALLTSACAVRSFPGEMWNEFRAPSGPFEHGTAVLDGRVQQGIDVGTLGPLRVIPFGEMKYRIDSDGLPWNNLVAPSIGVKLRTDFKNGFVQFGVQGFPEYRFVSGESGIVGLFFIQSWFGWDLK